MNKILISTEYGENMYDFDVETQKLSKVLRSFHSPDDSVTFDRFSYAYYPEKYRDVTKEDFNNYDLTCTYYLEDGSRPYKTRNCNNCDIASECSHNQKYYDR